LHHPKILPVQFDLTWYKHTTKNTVRCGPAIAYDYAGFVGGTIDKQVWQLGQELLGKMSSQTKAPTSTPTQATLKPSTRKPSSQPTFLPTFTVFPTRSPTFSPTVSNPTSSPTTVNEAQTGAPTREPTPPTTSSPTSQAPSRTPTASPTVQYTHPVILRYIGPNVVPFQSWNSTSFSFVNDGSTALYSIQAPIGFGINATCIALVNREVKTQLFTIANLSNNTFAYSGSSSSALPLSSNDTLPHGLHFSKTNGSILGTAHTATDLTAYPVTCVSYPTAVPAPLDFKAFYTRNRLFVQAWGRFGEIDDETGLMRDFWASSSSSYPSNQTQPYFCSVFWVGLNTYEIAPYAPNIISVAFHSVRNSAQPYMVFSDNSQFGTYQLSLLFGAIPFWALTLACIILYPSLICLKRWWFCRFAYCAQPANTTATKGSKKGKSVSKSTSSSSVVQMTSNLSTERRRFLCFGRCSCCRRRSPATTTNENEVTANNNNNGENTTTTTPTTTDTVPIINLASRRDLESNGMQRKHTRFLLDHESQHENTDDDYSDDSEIEEADQIVAKYQRQLDRILVSTSISKRLCFLFVAVFICGCISGLLVGFFQATAEFSSEYVLARTKMDTAYNASIQAYDILNDELINRPVSTLPVFVPIDSINQTRVQQFLIQERDRVSRFVSLANPANLRMKANLFPTLVIDSQVQTIVESVIFAIQILAPILTILSLSLASCTCKWNEYVLFENVSIFVGMSLRAYLIICAILAWFIVMFFFWNVSVVSDVCFLPSMINVPTFNSSQSVLTQPIAYDPNSNNYVLPNGQNLANFFWTCRYQQLPPLDAASGNPYSTLAVEANQLNIQARSLTPIVDIPFRARLDQLEILLQQMYLPMQCSQFGQFMTQGTSTFCFQVLLGNFLTFFFLCTIGITYMVTAPCTHWVAPNLYRQWQANKLYEKASSETEKLIKITTSTVSMRRLLANRAEGSSFKGTGTASFRTRVPSMRKSSRQPSKTLTPKNSSGGSSFDNRQGQTPKRLIDISPQRTFDTLPSDSLIASPPVSIPRTTASSNPDQDPKAVRQRQSRFFPTRNGELPTNSKNEPNGTAAEDDSNINHDLMLI
jgi:hypothetical protein